MPCRAASLPTTNRPMFLETAASTGGGFSSRQLAFAIISGFMPTPWSVTSTRTPPVASVPPEMSTGVSAADSDAAFSASSATRCTTSLTAGPDTAMSGCTLTETRSCSPVCATAALITSTSITGRFQRPGSSCPARTSRFWE